MIPFGFGRPGRLSGRVRFRLNGRRVEVSLRTGGPLKCVLKNAQGDGLVVEPGRHTRHWKDASGATRIPREEIVAVNSKGRTERRGLLGGSSVWVPGCAWRWWRQRA